MRLRRVLGAAVLFAALAPPAGAQQAEKAAVNFYFAEGTVRPGFVQMLTVMNPTDEVAPVEVAFFAVEENRTSRDATPLRFDVPPRGRVAENISEHLSSIAPVDVSLHVKSAKEIVAERSIYFESSLLGGVEGVHTAIGASTTARKHYFPQATAAEGHQQFLVFMNPGTINSRVRVSFLAAGTTPGQVVEVAPYQVEVPPGSRRSANLNDHLNNVGAKVTGYSLEVEASEPIVAERVEYFRLADLGGLTGGLVSPGASVGSGRYYFAEGSSRGGQVQTLTVMNLADEEADLEIILLGYDNTGKKIEVPPVEELLPPNARKTYDVVETMKTKGLVSDFEVSIEVSADEDLVVERTVYFKNDSLGGVQGGYAIIGTTLPSRQLYFPEGRVASDADTLITMLNPGNANGRVVLEYYVAGPDGAPVPVPDAEVRIEDESRAVHSVTKHLADNNVKGPVDVSVFVDSNVPVVAERSMVLRSSLAGGVQGGSLVVGFIGKGEGATVPLPLLVLGVIVIGLALFSVVATLMRKPTAPEEETPLAA